MSYQNIYSIAIGYLASNNSALSNTIVINASGAALNSSNTNATYIKPIRYSTQTSNTLGYTTEGEVVDTGSSAGGALIPYEAGPPQLMLSEWPLSNAYIWYMCFYAPSTASYSKATVFFTPASTNGYSGTFGVAIYSSTSQERGDPSSLLGSGTTTYSSATVDKTFQTVNFSSSISLTADTLYWFAIAATNTSGLLQSGYHNDYNVAYDIVRYEINGFTGSFPSSAGTIYDGEYAYYCRLS